MRLAALGRARRRWISIATGLLLLTFLTALFALVACWDPQADNEQFLGRACQSSADCPFYLTCGEGACRHRCRGNVCNSNAWTYCASGQVSSEVCREGACYPNPEYGSCNQSPAPTYPTSTTPTGSSAACAPEGTALRKDIPLGTPSSTPAGLALLHVTADATNVYVSSGTGIKAAKSNGDGPYVDLLGSDAGVSVTRLFRSGGSLFFVDATQSSKVSRLPIPPVTTPAAATVIDGSILVTTPSHVFVNRATGFFRIDATTMQETLLDSAFVLFATASQSHVFWLHPTAPGIGDSGGTLEVYRAPIAAGAATPTGAEFPPNDLGALGAQGADAVFYVQKGAGTIMKLDAEPGAAPSMFHAGPGSSVVFDAGYAYWATVTSGPSCTRMRRLSLADAQETNIAALGFINNGAGYQAIWVVNDAILWFDGSGLRRFPKPN